MAAKQMYDLGIATHSNRFLLQRFVIFCVGNSIARESLFKAWAAENGVWIKPLHGSYHGVSERSFLMTEEDYDRWSINRDWCAHEDSVLHLGLPDGRGRCPATLRYNDERIPTYLGLFQSCRKSTALSNPVGWTYDPEQDEYFICAKEK